MKHLGLFEGGGGFSLAANWMGWETVGICEIEESCVKVLKKHFPNAEIHRDIKQTDFTKYANRIDILTGGDPCQPHSFAGDRKGMDDERFLWPEMFRAIREAKPGFVVNENVEGTISNGVLDRKISDLEYEGYTCWPALIMPANAFGALHERNRVWLVAHSERNIQSRKKSRSGEVGRMGRIEQPLAWHTDWESALYKFRGMDDGLSRIVDRTDIMRNAIVPQIAYEIFKAIDSYEKTDK